MNPNAGTQKSLATNSHIDPDQRKIAALMALAENFRTEMSQSLMATWMRLLKPFAAEQVEAGADRLIRTKSGKLPVYADLEKAIREACRLPEPVDPEKSLKAQAEAEWEQVNDQVRRVGSYGNPRFHPTTERVIRSMGGWGAVCAWETASKEWKHKDFVRLWQDFHEVGDAMELGAFGVQQALAERMSQRPRELPSGFLKRIQ